MAEEQRESEPAAGARTPPRASSASSAEAVAAAGLRAGKPPREIAVDLYGREQVDADWHADSAMRSKLRRLWHWAEARSGAGPDGTEPGSV